MIFESNLTLELLPKPDGPFSVSDSGPGSVPGLGPKTGSKTGLDNYTDSNVCVWVGRMAELTAGYLPGDLSSIVRRAAG